MVKSTASVAAAVALLAGSAAAQATAGQWGQCGGKGWTGPVACPAGWSCQANGEWYSQCLQGAPATSAKVTTTSTSKPAVPTTTTTKAAVSSTKPASTSIAPATTSAAAPAPAPAAPASGFLAGVNLAGLEFGCEVWGWCSGSPQSPPLDQIAHFAAQGVNSFRIPFGWQYMTPTIGGALDAGFFAKYDVVVQAALKASTAPYVILDLHNYGRVQSGVVGKDGPSTAAFASLWSALAKKYASNSKIIFGLMNEPHDMDTNGFKSSLQEAVNAIRAAGAKTQMILLPGTDWTHASSFLGTNKAALSAITDPAGGKSLLIYDFHQYLDQDGSGTNRECVTDRADLWAPIAADLRRDGRKAMITEIGGASTDSCIRYLKSALTLIKANSDSLIGVNAWSAGAFNQGYELSLTPANGVDTPIWAQAIRPALLGSGGKAKRHEKARLAQH